MKKFLVVFLLFMFAATSCSQSSLSQRQAEKTAVIARKSDLVSFDSAAILDQNSLEMIDLYIEGLSTMNEENCPVSIFAMESLGWS